jgi:hypothetical protein
MWLARPAPDQVARCLIRQACGFASAPRAARPGNRDTRALWPLHTLSQAAESVCPFALLKAGIIIASELRKNTTIGQSYAKRLWIAMGHIDTRKGSRVRPC